MKKTLLFFVMLLSVASLARLQTTLVPGDIAVIGFNCDNPDEWAFVAMVDIAENTVIKFTDNGWLASGSFRSGEGVATWTAPAGGVLAGKIVAIKNDGGWTTTHGSVTAAGSFFLSGSGDQIIVYQGDDGTPTLLTAINSEGTGWQADATSSNTSALPLGLTNGLNAIALDEIDNAVYTMVVTIGTPLELMTAFCEPLNWTGDNSTLQTMPTSDFTIVSGTDTDPPVAIFLPANSATGVFVTSNITITFDEAIRNIDDSEITNVGSLLTFKETDAGGTDVAFTATIDINKKVITIVPDAYLSNAQVYYVAIAAVEDASDNATTGENISFTTIDGAGKEIAVELPEGGETYYAGELATIEWFSANVTTVNIDAWVPSDGMWVTMVPNTPSDGTESFTVPADAGYSEEYMIRVIDAGDPLVFGVSPSFTVISTPTIYLIQSTITTGDASDFAGHRVNTSGVVTAIDGGNFWLQDGSGAWNGIICYDYDAAGIIAVGDNITVDADVAEYTTSGSSLTELVEISNLVVNSSGNTLPEPTTITTGDYGEDFEGVLVKIAGAEVVNPDAGFGEFVINDGSGELNVDDKIYKYTATLGETIGVTGIGHDEYGDKILPRSADDIVDMTAPTFTSVPDDTETDVAIDVSIVLTFDEAIRNIDDSDVTDGNVGALLTFKKTDAAGADVPFTATIDVEKKIITLVASSDLDFSQLYYVAIASVEDDNDNAMSAASFTFTTVADMVAPVLSSVPNDAATDVAIDATVVVTSNEALRNIDDSEITDLNVASLIIFKETDNAGADVAFTATIDATKKIITITPGTDLNYTQVYYVAISPVEDASDNATTLFSFSFTTEDNTSSINGLGTDAFFEVYPNPNDGKFMIKLGSESGVPMDLEIMNVLGRTVYRNKTFGLHSAVEAIDISDVAPGLYYVRITHGQDSRIERIMIR